MTVHEFGKENKTCVVLIHPSLVMWDYFERVILLLEQDYHLIIPALPGYEPESGEDLQYMADMFQWLSYKTIWRTFESCNSYQMPAQVHTNCRNIQYWYGDKEKKERRLDLRYVRQYLSETKFVCMKNLGHGGMMLQRPEETAKRLRKLIEG